MLNEYKKVEQHKMQLLAFLVNGGNLDDIEDDGKLEGVDKPANDTGTAWLIGSGPGSGSKVFGAANGENWS